MSVESKVYDAVKGIFERIDNRIAELRRLRSDVNLLMRRSREELLNETNKLKEREDRVSKEEERVRQRCNRLFQEFLEEKESEARRIKEQINNAFEFAQLKISVATETFRKKSSLNELLTDSYITALFDADEKVAWLMQNKRPPNLNAANTIRGYKKELRELRIKLKDYEFIEEQSWEEEDETIEVFELAEEDEDAAHFFLEDEEYANLSVAERNQLALDRYLKRGHSKRWAGLMYEREVGWFFEDHGFDVTYRGIELGKKDGGIDLVCRRGNRVVFVQCKNRSNKTTIYEKHICQLYGATKFYSNELLASALNEPSLFSIEEGVKIEPLFVTSTSVDQHAKDIAAFLGITVLDNYAFTKSYPMIKCNINNKGEKIYHLPFDQMYDKVKINKPGERYCKTVFEAEQDGFRRAFRWRGEN